MTTRKGKIARLPLSIRNALDERLHNGEQGKVLVAWLNDLPTVQSILAEDFDNRPITEQNLSEWRQGGHLDWLRHQESLEWAERMREQVTELTLAADGMPLLDGISTLLTVALGRLLQSVMAQPLETPAQRNELLVLARELTRLRREDQRAAQLRLQQDKRADNQRKETEKHAHAEASQRECQTRPEPESMKAEPTNQERLQRVMTSLQLLTALSGGQQSATSEPESRANPAKSNQIKPLERVA